MSASFVELGRFLQAQRELKGLSRDDVARSTRIPLTLVAALEDGQSDRFPEVVFVVNHLRAYAQCLGLSADDVVSRFHQIPGTLLPTEKSPVALEAARRRRSWLIMGTVLAMLGVGVLGLWWWTRAQLEHAPRKGDGTGGMLRPGSN